MESALALSKVVQIPVSWKKALHRPLPTSGKTLQAQVHPLIRVCEKTACMITHCYLHPCLLWQSLDIHSLHLFESVRLLQRLLSHTKGKAQS